MTIHNRSAAPAAGHRRPLRLIVPIPPRASPRACLEAQIDFLLDMLDRIDGDPDLEDGADHEPYLAGAPTYPLDAEMEADNEPSLGSLDRAVDQRRWTEGDDYAAYNECELDEADEEPSLGWANPLGARVDGQCQLIVESVPDRQVRP